MCRIEYAYEDGFWIKPLKEQTARKEHRCSDCWRIIVAGERYTYGSWLNEYGFNTIKMCGHCLAAGHWLRVICGGHLYPGVVEELREHWDEEFDLRSHGLGRLVKLGEDQWERHGQLVSVADIERWVESGLARVPAKARR